MLIVAGLVVATFVSEDAACVAAGLLVQRGEVSAAAAVGACALGIFLGDLGLWAIGRFGRQLVLGWPVLARRVPEAQAARVREWLTRRPAAAIVTSRFVPGTRLPVYVGAGLAGMSGLQFSRWAALAVLLWAPVPVLGTALASEAALMAPGAAMAPRWLPPAMAAAAILIGWSLLSRREARGTAVAFGWLDRLRRRVAVRLARASRWEFWPAWLFYAPVSAWVCLLAIRYRGFTTMTAANPGIPDGGIVGESKFDILQKLPAEWTIPSARIEPGDRVERSRVARATKEAAGWQFPIVLKPDAGQRGAGVRLVSSHHGLDDYLARVHAPVLMQPYHPGPHEAGLFYCRFPGEARGRLLTVTDKRFPCLEGDGRSTLAELIRAHPRYRLQADLFLRRRRRDADRVLAAGEQFVLTHVGNHAQGTIFNDGAHLWTPALEARVDEIARACPGFFIGRFDVRYRSVEAFMAGEDLAIVELNGATGEPTNVYDPNGSLVGAYRGLFRQWALVFAVGHANRLQGARPSTVRRLLDLLRAHLLAPPAWSGLD